MITSFVVIPHPTESKPVELRIYNGETYWPVFLTITEVNNLADQLLVVMKRARSRKESSIGKVNQ